MSRFVVLTMCTLGVLCGCAEPKWPELPQKPGPAPEMAELERFVGSWTETVEMVSPSPEEMKQKMPEGAEEMPSSFEASGKADWALEGMFLKFEGSYEMWEGQTAHYVEYVTWDPKAKKYHSWHFSDWGEFGEGWWTLDPDGETFHVKVKGLDAQGNASRGRGSLTFVDDDTYNWSWSESGPMGKMKFKGTSKRAQ